MRLARIGLGWLCYLASAVPFVAFVATAFWPDGRWRETAADSAAVNALIFAAAGVTAVLVKHVVFNAAMAVDAIPYASFLFDHRSSDPSTWSANDVEGSVVYVSIYCMIGMASTAVWLLMRASAIWRWARRASLHDGGAPPGRG